MQLPQRLEGRSPTSCFLPATNVHLKLESSIHLFSRMAMYPQISPPKDHGMPPDTPHSVSNSLPEWQDNVDVVLGKMDILDKLETTYPRFAIHPFVKQLTDVILKAFDTARGWNAFLFPTRMLADECRSFITTHFPLSSSNVYCATEVAMAPPGHHVFAILSQQRGRQS
ncbi:hypothetical protein B0H10DRAFT_339337 [Mycena sp. CBHHK59/15]|nr:hypothetical protein B0H10DRAFT_339337 [Mycena sp. CBHHK59/15]